MRVNLYKERVKIRNEMKDLKKGDVTPLFSCT